MRLLRHTTGSRCYSARPSGVLSLVKHDLAASNIIWHRTSSASDGRYPGSDPSICLLTASTRARLLLLVHSTITRIHTGHAPFGSLLALDFFDSARGPFFEVSDGVHATDTNLNTSRSCH